MNLTDTPSWLQAKSHKGGLLWHSTFSLVHIPSEPSTALPLDLPGELAMLESLAETEWSTAEATKLLELVHDCGPCGGRGELWCRHCARTGRLTCLVTGCEGHVCDVCGGDGRESCVCREEQRHAAVNVCGAEFASLFLWPLRLVLKDLGAAKYALLRRPERQSGPPIWALAVQASNGSTFVIAQLGAAEPGEDL